MIIVNNKPIEIGNFPDGTLLVKLAEEASTIIIEWKYENDAELFALICISKHLRELNPSAYFVLKMLYLPNARMDRVVESSDVFTFKYFAEIINFLNFAKVLVLDPHSTINKEMIVNIEVISPKLYIEEALKRIKQQGGNPSTVFYVDKGGRSRYSDMLQIPSVYGEKERDWNSGQIIGTKIIGDTEFIKGKEIIIIDDIISYGGSIYYNAIKLKELGCNDLYVFATHMENSILDENRGILIKSGLIKRLYTTDSLINKQHESIEIISI
jgi:ribose-phosphate pyrophosphokinase